MKVGDINFIPELRGSWACYPPFKPIDELFDTDVHDNNVFVWLAIPLKGE
ncbi:MAG: hypothetical protein ACUVQY_01110 [Thermoproteota archaeon]